MKSPSDDWDDLRQKVMGLGDTSIRKTHYPSLRQRLAELQRFRSLVDISSDLLFVVEYPSGRILDVSAASCDRLATDRQSLLSRSFADLVPAATWQATLSLLERQCSGGQRGGMLTTEIGPPESQCRLPVEIAVQYLRVGDSFLAMLAARDITERQKAEQRILKLNRLYAVVTAVNKTIVKAQRREIMFQEICRLCIDCGQFRMAWIALFDSERRALRPVAWAGGDPLVAPTGDSHSGNPYADSIRDGRHYVCNDLSHEPIAFHMEAVRRGYRSACVVPLKVANNLVGALALYAGDPYFFDEEEVGLLDDVASDISFAVGALDREEQRCRAEQTTRETHRTVEAILEASPVAIVALDAEGRVTAWNKASEEMFGWSVDEVIGRSNPVVPEHLEGERLEIRDRVLRGEVFSGELKRQRKDGSQIDVSLSAAPLHDADGKIIGTMAIYADISERKRLESQLLQAHKLESVGRLAGGIAHDFNNLLTVVNGHAELLLNRLPQHDPLWFNASEICKAGQRAADLTSQLLAFSRKQVLQPKILSINAVVSEMENMLRRLIGEDVQLVTTLDPQVGSVKADPTRLQQIIMNLVLNARDAISVGGMIAIRTGNLVVVNAETDMLGIGPGDYVTLSVTDDGVGIDEDTQRHIFEPFFTTKETGKGTGLGLSTVWGIVNQSGGHVRLRSELNHGSTFTIYLPNAQGAVAIEQCTESNRLPRGTETLLIVEDRDDVRQLTAEILKGCGYCVLQARTPMEGLKLWLRNVEAIRLVVTDVVMPEMTGPQLVEQIRSVRRDTRVLYMSGHAGEAVLDASDLGHSAAFLEKPFSAAQLATAVRQLLGITGERVA